MKRGTHNFLGRVRVEVHKFQTLAKSVCCALTGGADAPNFQALIHVVGNFDWFGSL